MVHHAVPRVLYEHPVVEYIPLTVASLHLGADAAGHHHPAGGGGAALLNLHSVQAWVEAVAAYPLAFASPEVLPSLGSPLDTRRELVFLARGFRVSCGIYRGRKVSLVAPATGTITQLFTVPRLYFYKNPVDFWVYDHGGRAVTLLKDVDVGARPLRPRRPGPNRGS